MFVCLLPEKNCKLVPRRHSRASCPGFQRGSFENEDSKTKTEARSTQNSKTKHLNLENEAPIENEAPKTRNHCRLNNYNFTSSMGEAPREKNNVLSPSWEPYQTVSAVYFILGILRTDLWSQSSADLSPVRKKTPQSLVKQESLKGDFNWVVSFPGGEGGCTHSGPPGLSLTIALHSISC